MGSRCSKAESRTSGFSENDKPPPIQRIKRQEVQEANDEMWPYVWAIRDHEVLDWREGLSEEEVHAGKLEQAALPVQIGAEYLFLGDAKSARDLELLKERGITHVLNVASSVVPSPTEEYDKAGIIWLEIPAQDEDGYAMLGRHLEECRRFIAEARAAPQGKCLVHCQAGVNRSGVVVAAEKMLAERMPVIDVVAHCRRMRGNVFLGNYTFQDELVALAQAKGLLGPKPGTPGSHVSMVPPPKQAMFT